MPTAVYNSWIASWHNHSGRLCPACFGRNSTGLPNEATPAPMHPNSRYQAGRTLPWNKGAREISLSNEEARSPDEIILERHRYNAQPSRQGYQNPGAVFRPILPAPSQAVSRPILPAPSDMSQVHQSFMSISQNAQREVAVSEARDLAAKHAVKGAHSPCFVDDCAFTAPRLALPDHLRTEHGIVHLRRDWRRQTMEQWTAVHPVNCPLESCDLAWKGAASKRGIMRHVQMSHWIGPKNKLPSGKYVCHVCAEFSPDLPNAEQLVQHLEAFHRFSCGLPFNSMDHGDEEDDNEVSSSPHDHANPPYSPSWRSDMDIKVRFREVQPSTMVGPRMRRTMWQTGWTLTLKTQIGLPRLYGESSGWSRLV